MSLNVKDANPKIIEARSAGAYSNRRPMATATPTTGAPKTHHLPGHRTVVRLRGRVPSTGPRCDRRSGVDPASVATGSNRWSRGGATGASPASAPGGADPRLLSPQQRRGAAERRHPGSHPGTDRRTRRRRLVGERRSRAATPTPAKADQWRKGTDTHMWFDSGSSWAAVASQREQLELSRRPVPGRLRPARGWFQFCSPRSPSMATFPPTSGCSPMASPWMRRAAR